MEPFIQLSTNQHIQQNPAPPKTPFPGLRSQIPGLVYFLLWPTNKKPLTIHCKRFIFKLSDQGSNLDSSDSESDVLPITPSGIFF